MRNLKKVLALVLAMAMSLSLAVTAGAAFNDQDKIVNTEAVDMCVALNIINGRTDGSFDPAGNVTRAEMAKMICIVLNGGKEPATATKAVPTYADIDGHWAEGYIEYCSTKGVVAGVGGGNFNPNGSVTGSQAAKMLLVALGYNADVEKMVGANWELYTNVLANQDGLYEDLESMDPSAALSRDNAAQMIWNALQAKEIEKNSSIDRTDGSIIDTYSKGDDDLLTAKYGVVTDDASMLQDVEEDEKGTYTVTTADAEYTKVAADYSDLIGQNVKVVHTDGKTDDVFGVYAHEDSAVIAEGVVGQLKLDSDADAKSIKLNGTAYDLDQAANATDCRLMNGNAASDKLSGQMIPSQAEWTVKLIDNDGDGDVNLAVLTKVDVAKITYANASGIRVGATEFKYEDHNIYEGAAKDDWAVIVDADYTVDGEAVITKADTVSGKVTSVKTNAAGTATTEVRIDGVWYKAAIVDTTAISAEVDLVVYEGMYFNVDTMTTSLDVAVVTGVGNYDKMNDVVSVKLMFADGKEQVVPVEAWASFDAATVAEYNWVGELVSYEIDEGNYTLTTVPNGAQIASTDYNGIRVTAGANDGYTKDISAVEIGATDYDVADNAMIVFYDGDKYTYMTGADLLAKNDIAFTSATEIMAAVDGTEIVALYAETGTSISSGDEQYGYIVAVGEELNAAGDKKMYIDVVVNGEKLTSVETDKTSASGFVVGDVITYTMNGDVMNVTEVTSSFSSNKAAIKEFNDTRVIFHGTPDARVTLANDVVVIAIDSDDADDVLYAGSDLIAANANSFDASGVANGWYNNAMYHLDGTEIDVIFVEIDADSEF